jgi:purine catabolism regulator
MALTVRELTEIPYLRTRIHAGAAGADRRIGWAHSIEIPRPWEWLEEGDLLMTVGLGIPEGSAEQVTYVEQLAAVGASGVAIGEEMHAPPLTPAMIEAADRVELPLLFTAFEVPFVQISRAVAASDQDADHERLVRAVRIYDRARVAVVQGSSSEMLLRGLGEEIGCDVVVCENERGASVFAGKDGLPDAARAAFLAAVRERDGILPGILRLAAGDDTVVVVPVPSRRPASLLAIPRSATAPPYALLQHVATVAALEVERLWASREELRRLGSETLAHLVDGRITSSVAAPQLQSHGFGDGPFVVLAVQVDDPPSRRGWLHHALAECGIPNLLLRRAETLYCMVRSDDQTLGLVFDILGPQFRVGVSDPFEQADGAAAAARQARWAVEDASEVNGSVSRYGDVRSVFGLRSVAEAEEAVGRILGPVRGYDQANGTELVRSLAVFLRCNRSWQKASAELFVHKQTLVYRMRRVEELTGRKLNDTAGVAELWVGVTTMERLGELS